MKHLHLNKPPHGGKREGAGRPKLPKSMKKEKTKVMRIPISLVETVEKLIEDYNEFVKPNNTK